MPGVRFQTPQLVGGCADLRLWHTAKQDDVIGPFWRLRQGDVSDLADDRVERSATAPWATWEDGLRQAWWRPPRAVSKRLSPPVRGRAPLGQPVCSARAVPVPCLCRACTVVWPDGTPPMLPACGAGAPLVQDWRQSVHAPCGACAARVLFACRWWSSACRGGASTSHQTLSRRSVYVLGRAP